MEKLAKYIPLNFQLVVNPINWVIVFLMLALASVGLALIIQSSSDASNIVEE